MPVGDVRLHHSLPVGKRCVGHELRRERDACVVYECIDKTKALAHAEDDLFCLLLVRNVPRNEHDGTARRLELCKKRARLRLPLAIMNRDTVAFFSKAPCDASADAARGACHQYCTLHAFILANRTALRNAAKKETGKG